MQMERENDFSESQETALLFIYLFIYLFIFLHGSILNQDDTSLYFMLRHHFTVKNVPMLC